MYFRHTILKRDGSPRELLAPDKNTKRLQRQILDRLYQFPVHQAAHGFVPGRSIFSHAGCHLHQKSSLHLDLKNFFPSITRRMLQTYQYWTNDDLNILLYENRLPQGAPSSPYVANLVCYRLDSRVFGLAKSHDLIYSRYADDLVLSSSYEEKDWEQIFKRINTIVTSEGFRLNSRKTRLVRGLSRRITGLVVTDVLNATPELLTRYKTLDKFKKQQLKPFFETIANFNLACLDH